MDSSEVWLRNARRLVFHGDTQNLNQTSVDDLRTYLAGYEGRYFERLYDRVSRG